MTFLSIDLETYSSIPIKDCGAYRYVDSDDFEVLLFAYAFDDEQVKCVDLAQGEDLPEEVKQAMFDKNIIKTAYNASFERACLSKYFGTQLYPEDWLDTMAVAWMSGYAGGLDVVSKSMGFPVDKQKDSAGKALIKYFCCPCKPTKTNGGRTRNLPKHNPEKWDMFKAYNIQDVVVEREIRKRLDLKLITKFEKELWDIDQRISDRGVRIDTTLAENAVELNNKYTERLLNESKQITGVDNPNSREQVKAWVESRLEVELDAFDKEAIKNLLEKVKDEDVKRVLEIRQLTSKTSVKKYKKMLDCVCSDGRAHGILQYYGATRSGRWAGRLIQLQNLPANHMEDLDFARICLLNGDYDTMELFWETSDTSSQLIRTALIPSEGCRFLVADYSAIEARVIAWLAGETWRQEVFAGDGKIYEASASQMFGVPVKEIKKGSELRKRGKVAELACGYGGSVGALYRMGGDKIKCPDDWTGTHEEYLKDIVDHWRESSPNIVKLWWDVDTTAKKCIEEKCTSKLHHGIQFIYRSGNMYIRLPSGRKLSYVSAQIEPHKEFSRDVISYMGLNQITRKWERIQSYGPKLVENIIQAIARDCLATSIVELEKQGFPVLFHVHDEVIVEKPVGVGSLDDVYEIMSEPIPWADGLLLRADGYECNYYLKD